MLVGKLRIVEKSKGTYLLIAIIFVRIRHDESLLNTLRFFKISYPYPGKNDRPYNCLATFAPIGFKANCEHIIHNEEYYICYVKANNVFRQNIPPVQK